jgi:hypothetical protein
VEILIAISLGFAALGIAFMGLAVKAFRGRRWMGTAGRTGSGALFVSLSALAGTLGASTHGYRSLTMEEVAMTVTTVPTGPHAFQAYVEFPDGRDTTLAVSGDQVLVDAHILKWRYVGNLLGPDRPLAEGREARRPLRPRAALLAPRLSRGRRVRLGHLHRGTGTGPLRGHGVDHGSPGPEDRPPLEI